MANPISFTGSVPYNYDRYLGPLFLEPYALDIKERLQQKGFENVLELACGTGRVTKHLIGAIAENGKLVATDLNKEMMDVAKEKVTDERIKWQVDDAQELPFGNNEFDLVVCQFGVMFFSDKQKAFEETYRVLKNGGRFLFNVWDDVAYNDASLITQSILKEVFKDNPPQFFKKGPYSFNDKKEIEQLLTTTGFKNIKIEVVAKNGFAANADDIIKGTLEGSPLTNYLTERAAPVDEIKQKLKSALEEKYGNQNLYVPMQALVCTACR